MTSSRSDKNPRSSLMAQFLRFVISLLLCLSMIEVAHGGEADKLIDGARKEGRLVFSTAVETEVARALPGGFEARSPFIKTDTFRSSHEKILSRMNVERRTGT